MLLPGWSLLPTATTIASITSGRSSHTAAARGVSRGDVSGLDVTVVHELVAASTTFVDSPTSKTQDHSLMSANHYLLLWIITFCYNNSCSNRFFLDTSNGQAAQKGQHPSPWESMSRSRSNLARGHITIWSHLMAANAFVHHVLGSHILNAQICYNGPGHGPLKVTLPKGWSGIHLIHGCFDPYQSASQMVSRSLIYKTASNHGQLCCGRCANGKWKLTPLTYHIATEKLGRVVLPKRLDCFYCNYISVQHHFNAVGHTLCCNTAVTVTLLNVSPVICVHKNLHLFPPGYTTVHQHG